MGENSHKKEKKRKINKGKFKIIKGGKMPIYEDEDIRGIIVGDRVKST